MQRIYKHIVKATMYLGENSWSDLEDFPTSQVRFDGGASAGWNLPTYQQPATMIGQDQGNTGPGQGQDNIPASAVATEVGGGSIPRGQQVSYIRVSTAEQNLARQRESTGPVDREFQDKISARSRDNRKGLEDCIDYLRGHDQLYVASIDRLARSLVDLQSLISQITDKGASVHFLKENLVFAPDRDDPRAQLMLGILGSFAQFERSIIRERQAEGISLAKKAGKYKGRKRALTPDDVEKVRRRVESGESKVAIAQDLGIGRATLYRALAE